MAMMIHTYLCGGKRWWVHAQVRKVHDKATDKLRPWCVSVDGQAVLWTVTHLIWTCKSSPALTSLRRQLVDAVRECSLTAMTCPPGGRSASPVGCGV